MKTLFLVATFVAMIFGSVYFQWWRCGEMFPNAQLACFLSSK